MNDPLRDNRIFPEEMHDKPPVATKKHPHFSWAWFTTVALVILLLLGVGYFYTTKIATRSVDTSLDAETLQQQATAEFIEQNSPQLSSGERDQKINALFNNL